jgi:hypothetical protein
MGFDPRTGLEPIAAGPALICTVGCGCGGGCGGSCGCGGACGGGCGCGGSCGAGADIGEPAVLPVPITECSDRTWTTCPAGQAGYSAGDPSGDALDRSASLATLQYSQVLAPLLAAERPSCAVGACLRVNLSNPSSRSLMVQFALPCAGCLPLQKSCRFYC